MRANGALLLIALITSAAAEEALVSPIASSMAMVDGEGRTVTRLAPRQVVRVRLHLSDPSGVPARLPEGVRGYIRTLGDEPVACAGRARMFRATGAVAQTDHRFDGALILALTGQHVALINPAWPGSSNTLALAKVPVAEPRLVTHVAGGHFAVQAGMSGPAYRIRIPDLGFEPLPEIAGGTILADAKGIYILRSDALVRSERSAPYPLPGGPWQLTSARTPILTNAAGTLRLLPDIQAEDFVDITPPAGSRALAASSDGALVVVAGAGDEISIGVVASGQFSPVRIGQRALWGMFAPDNRHFIALLEEGRTLALVDGARGRLVQAVAMARPVRDLRFAADSGFIQSDNGSVYKFDASALARGIVMTPAALAAPAHQDASDPLLPPLALLADGSGVLASAYGGDRIGLITGADHRSLNGAPAAPPTQLRTERALAVGSVQAGFIQVSTGVYEAPFSPRAWGMHALILADRDGKFSACHTFRVGEDDPQREAARRARLELITPQDKPAARLASKVMLRLAEAPAEICLPEQVDMDVMELGSSWRGKALGARVGDQQLEATIIFPRPGRYVLQPRHSHGIAALSRPVLVEVKP